MSWLDRVPIRWQLVLVSVVTSAFVELIALSVIIVVLHHNYREQQRQQFAVEARVLAANLSAPLAFGDKAAARQYLATLRANQEIAVSGAYGSDGTLFAAYPATAMIPHQLNPRLPPRQRFGSGILTVSQPITQANARLGTVYLAVRTESLLTQLAHFSVLMLLAVLGSMLIAIPVSLRLNQSLSSALRAVAASAARVTAGDLDFDPPSTSRRDEVGVLMTAFKQMLASLRETLQQERLLALGQMSSGIAHDINNAMSPLALYTASLLETERTLSDRVRNYLEMVQRVVADVTITVGRMRDFSRKREPGMVLNPIDLNKLARQVIDFTRVRWKDMLEQSGHVIATETELAENLPQIMGIEGEIREALTNLVFNAVDAMSEGGTLAIRTRVSAKGAGHVEIEVADSGCGMDEETRRRCLEPFFTTKGERGTGLGMAMVYGIVQRLSGQLEIDSAPGLGTTIRLTFLARSEPAALTPAQPKTTTGPRALRLLVIDDDPAILDSMVTVLELDGHTIVPASGGQHGIDLFREAKEREQSFSAVITDLGMPYVDGNQVAAAIKALSPKTPIILLTGWGHNMSVEGKAPLGVDFILGKPPDLDELRQVFERVGEQLGLA